MNKRFRSTGPIGFVVLSLVLTYFSLALLNSSSSSIDPVESPNGRPPLRPSAAIPTRCAISAASDDSVVTESTNVSGLVDLRSLPGISEVEYPAVACKAFSEMQKRRILESIVKHILTSDSLTHTREFYGEGKKIVGLVDTEALSWPDDFPSRFVGYELVNLSEEKPERLEKLSPFLLISIDTFLSQSEPWGPVEGILLPFQGPIIAVVSNYGSLKQGGCFVGFVPAIVKGKWIALAKWLKDP